MSNLTEIFGYGGLLILADPLMIGLVLMAVLAFAVYLYRIPMNVTLMISVLLALTVGMLDYRLHSFGILVVAIGGGVIFFGIWSLLKNQ